MKFQSIKISLLLLVAAVMGSCEKQEEQAVANLSTAKAAGISASASTIALKKETKDAEVLKMTVTAADYGYKAAVKYTLQFDVKGNNFAKPKEISVDASNFVRSFKGVDLNDIALALGIKAETAGVVQARVKSEISNSVAPSYSPIVEITVTPFALITYIYVPGDYQGWNPASADSLVSALGDGKYEGVINFAAKLNSLEFKITPAKKWDIAYGDAGAGKVSTTAGNNLKVSTLYPHKITLDLNDNTIKTERFSYGVIGDATPGGWGMDTDMTYNNGTRTWSVVIPLIGGKELKFRLNDDWGTNYGDKGADGTLDNGGDNIKVTTSGNYRVSFSFVTNTYSLTKL